MLYYRRFTVILGVLLAASFVLIAVYWKPFVLDLAQKQFKARFKGFALKIGSIDLTPRAIALRDSVVTKMGQQQLKIKEFRINFTLSSLMVNHTVDFSIKEAAIYDKLNIAEAHGKARVGRGYLSIHDMRASVLGGTIEADGVVRFGKSSAYSADLKCTNIQLDKIVETFELGEKIDVRGCVSGSVRVAGKRSSLTGLGGRVIASPEGGTLTIKSKEWLDAIAGYVKQDPGIIVESFQNYRYNTGEAVLELKGSVINIYAHLNGEAGMRDLLIALHGF